MQEVTKGKVCGALQTLAGSVHPHVVLVNGKQVRTRQLQALMQRRVIVRMQMFGNLAVMEH
jgi:hypothetical protein